MSVTGIASDAENGHWMLITFYCFDGHPRPQFAKVAPSSLLLKKRFFSYFESAYIPYLNLVKSVTGRCKILILICVHLASFV